METSEAFHWTPKQQQKIDMDPELYTPKIENDSCDRDVWRHLRLFIGHENNNNKRIFQGLISTLQLVEKLDRYPLRNKRKIDSVEPEETSMNVKKEGTQRMCSKKKENSKLQAEKKLKIRAQLKGESTEFYIQDVLCLCKEADLQMSEEDKISQLMKGIAGELYQALLPRDVQSTEQFITECRRVEALRCRRVTPTRYELLPNVASLCDQDDGEDLSSLIRKIVREEIQQALDSPHEEPKIAVIEDLVREEIVKTLAPRSKPTISPPQASRPEPNTRYEAQTIRPHPEPHYRKQGKRCDTNEWRTTEGKPICFYCGRPGHVVRYCRDRKRHNEERRNEYFRRKQDAMEFYNSQTESQEPNDESSGKNFSRYRSPTPYTGRNRPNFSPARRSSWSPPP
ncbi:ASPRV1 [Cordylochernes scorpioides]|uniref:ASPRV1 n=1 Tax=Cordylochernes scorpioides TaxID=51811 RepID=A0ABY6LB46_9ARAC|nr:ASPRV1 [Cordylochernes scorpioides]